MSSLRQFSAIEQAQEKKETTSNSSIHPYPNKYSHHHKLLTEKEIDALKELNLTEGYYQRDKNCYSGPNRIHSRYSIASLRGTLYAVYREHDRSKFLAKGGVGKVKLVQNLLSGDYDTVTKIAKANCNDEKHISQLRLAMENELEILKILGQAKSDLIIRKSRKTGLPKFQFFAKRALGNELFSLIEKNELPMDALKLKRIAFNLIKEVKKFFDLGYLHRDLKIENVFVDLETEQVTLIDFGFAIKMNRSHTASDGIACGSIDTVAPEILNGSSLTYSEATEVYAVGIVLRALLFGEVMRPAQLTHDAHRKLYHAKKFESLTELVEMRSVFPASKNGFRLVSSGSDYYKIEDELYKFVVNDMCNKHARQRPSLKKAIDKISPFLVEHEPVEAVAKSSTLGFYSKRQAKNSSYLQERAAVRRCIIL